MSSDPAKLAQAILTIVGIHYDAAMALFQEGKNI